MAEGFNGTPTGFDNNCEYEKPIPNEPALVATGFQDLLYRTELVTKPEVLHAESNAIAKMALSTQSSVGSTMYCTDTPCFNCAKLIIQAGVRRLVYARDYHGSHPTGLDLLREAEIIIDKLDVSSHNTDDGLDHQDEGCYDSEEDSYRS
jgi:dCMP deaminase